MNDQAGCQPSPIRVLALIEASSVTGPAKNLLMVARELASLGAARIRIVTFSRGKSKTAFVAACEKAGVVVDVIGERGRFDPGVIPQLRNIIAGYQPDIIQSHNTKSHFLIRLCGVYKDIPWVAFNHGYTAEDLKARLYNQVDRWSLRRAHRVVAVCASFAEVLRRRGVREDRLVVRHNAVSAMPPSAREDVDRLRDTLGIPPDAVVLLSVGRLSREKAHADLIHAIAALKGRGTTPNFRLVMVGAGPELSRLQALCGSLAVSELVIWAGTTTNAPLYYALGDIFILPSHSEGSPNVLLEAMMSGLPVVATAVGGVPEIIRSGVTGLLVPAKNPDSMAQRVVELMANPESGKEMGDRARNWVTIHHSPESYVGSMAELYRSVVQVPPTEVKLNVLLLIDSLAGRGGTETQLMEVASRVGGARIHLCCLESGPVLPDLPSPHTVRVFPVTKVNSLAALREILRLRAYIRRHKIDVVQTFTFKASVIGVTAAWAARCQAIVTSRRNLQFAQGHGTMARFLNRLTTRILANSETVKSKVVETERVAPETIDVLHNGVDVRRFASDGESGSDALERLGIPTGAAIVGIVANLRPVKDVAFFLEAAREIADAVPEAAFLIVGQGPLRSQLEALASRLGIARKVFFAGGVEDVSMYLRHFEVGCLSSREEGFSNAILEYMAAGIPAVATAVGGNGEAIVHGVTGYLVQGRNAAEFASHVVGLLRDEEFRKAMGRRAQARCRELFDIHEIVRRHEDYWISLVNQPGRTAPMAARAGR